MSVDFVCELPGDAGYDLARLQKVAQSAVEAVAACDCLPAAPCVCVLFTDDAGIQKLNAQMRGVDSPTDVLSFPLIRFCAQSKAGYAPRPRDLDVETGELLRGDIAVSVQRVKAQAREYGHSFERELAYLCAHGMCHLLGYDHETGADKAAMRALEERAMEKFI